MVGTKEPALLFNQVTRVLSAVKQDIADSIVGNPITKTEIETKRNVVNYDLNIKLHNFILLSPNSDSVQVQILLAVCQRYAMVRIPDNGFEWK